MSRVLALTRREVAAYFFAPVPYLVMFLFLLLTWAFFQLGFDGQRAEISYGGVFQFVDFTLLFLIPLLTMNTVAEERSKNTLEALLTAPVHDWQVILAKWLGTLAFYVTMLLPTIVYWFVLSHLGQDIGKPDAGPVFAAYVGVLFLGGLYMAIGIFASSLTENALLSAFLAFFILIGLLVFGFLPFVRESFPEWLRAAIEYLSTHQHFDGFLKGKIAMHDVVYFVSMTAFFLFLAVRALESRKWR